MVTPSLPWDGHAITCTRRSYLLEGACWPACAATWPVSRSAAGFLRRPCATRRVRTSSLYLITIVIAKGGVRLRGQGLLLELARVHLDAHRLLRRRVRRRRRRSRGLAAAAAAAAASSAEVPESPGKARRCAAGGGVRWSRVVAKRWSRHHGHAMLAP
jgi:hypothetical protein